MPHVFISYARADLWVMRAVRYFLTSQGLRTWADETGLRPGTTDWRQTLWRAMDESSCLLALCTPAAAKSPWVGRELDRALELNLPIFSVLARGDSIQSIPRQINHLQFSDASQQFESGLAHLLQAIDDDPRVVNVRRASASLGREGIRWDRMGSVFWFASEGRKLRLQLTDPTVSLADISRGLRQLRHHARRLNATRFIVREIDLVLQEAAGPDAAHWTPERRLWHADRLRVAFDTIARLAEDADPDFEPGPRWAQESTDDHTATDAWRQA